ncbi:CIR protein PIR protein [Plasmodium vinckei petteri]|uniref:CIR protein PIR protein n=1 Tax=Plasmodium vinckei petteri TaxID=138298 RepID=A0A6V7SFS6_PLAVN|nr:CIR protein PIR protein [Plasmodium vinckei petteri]
MEAKELCKNFISADKIINGGYYDTMTMEDKTKYPEFNKYCSNSKCETNMQLNSLSEDLFNQLGTEIEDEYYEYFTMWLSDKLFKIANDENNPQINDITLNSAYEKYLKKNIKNGNYWNLLDIKQGLKEVNLMHMKHFYKLLNDICKAIVYYKPNDDDIKKFIINSTECYNQYSSLYKSVPKCNSYHHLLGNLKKIYEDFKNSVHDKIKKEYPHLAGDLQTLTIENTDSYFVEKFKAFDFNSSECNPQNTKTGGLSHKNGSEDSKSKPKDSENSKGNAGDTTGNKGNSNSKNGSPGGGKDSGGGDPGSGENGGSKESGDQDVTDPSEKSNGGWTSLWGTSLNPMSYMPSASSIYQASKDVLISTTNKISDTYTNTMISITGAYNNAMTSITDAYDRTTNYIGNAVNSITSQLNQFSTQLGDNQSGSNSSEGGTDTSNHSQQNPPPPSLLPSPSPSVTSPSTPQLSQTPSSSQPQDPPQTPSLSQPQSNKTQDKLKIKDQNGTSNTLQQPVPNTEAGGVQTLPITQVALPNSITDPPSTWNGIITGTIVKMNEKSSIWCIAQNKKYGILGIGVISISIFAFLAIMYKYLSLGRTIKSKRKKSVKKVINSIGGKRPIQIIIKSYDRNKDLKPVINSVDRKKDPLLNIYKLMQADPVPFINVFFLLIFFVYKRQLNYLEL